MQKVIKIENKNILMKSDGGTARLYRQYFKRDFISDLSKMEEARKGKDYDTEVFENLAWVLAKRANDDIPEIMEWLSSFNSPLSIYAAAKDVLALVSASETTIVKPKKKKKQMQNR